MKKLIFLAVFGMLVFNSCNKDESNPIVPPTGPTGAISGVVFTFQGNPIAGALISTQPQTSTQNTNAQGNFYIGKITPGNYTITASNSGYESITQLVTVIADTTMPIAFTLNLLSNKGSIAGKITDANSAPLPGALISTTPTTYAQYTNEFGNYLIENVPTGPITVTASMQGYVQNSQNISVNSGATTLAYISLNVTTASTGTINGKVTDNNNVPIQGATVSTQPVTSTVSTDNLGNFTITNVNPGTYTVSATKTGYTGNSQQATVTAGGTTTANIQMSQIAAYGSISGTIRDNSSNPLPGVTISTQPLTSTTTTDNSGNYTISNVTPGVYSVNANKSGYNPGSLSVTVSANNITMANISLTSSVTTGTISGRVTDISSNGISNAEITTQPATGTVMTDNSGYYTLSNVAPGTYTVSASKAGFVQASQSASVTAGSTTTVNLVLTASSNCPATVSYEGKTYQVVLIGTQCWFKENLDVGQQINSILNPANNGTIEKYCYENNQANCATYGGLYTWNEAMKYATAEGGQGICPTGWHIPTRAELVVLNDLALSQGKRLLTVGQGNGTNETGFSALLTGGFSEEITGKTFWGLGATTQIHSSTTIGSDQRTNLVIPGTGSGQTYFQGVSGGLLAISVRCLKD